MYDEHREEGLEVLGIAFVEGGEEGRKWLTDYMGKKKMTWRNALAGGPQWFGPPMEGYDVSFLPFNLILDREGRVVELGTRAGKLDDVVARVLADARRGD